MQMKRIKNLLTLAIAGVASLIVTTSTQATLVTFSQTAPTVDGADIASLGATSGLEKFWTDTRAIGQTFKMGAEDAWLDAITLRTDRISLATKTYEIRVGAVSGNTFAEIASATTTATQSGAAAANDYVTYTLDTPVLLAAGMDYGFDIGMKSSTSGWRSGIPYMYQGSNASYADGQAYRSTINNTGTSPFSFLNGDKVFHLNLTADTGGGVPEPATATLALLGLGGLMMRRRRNA